MSTEPVVRRDRSDDPRDDSRLELDDDLACKDCGLVLPFDAVLLYEYERCPECHLEREREKLTRAFGSIHALDAAQSWDNQPDNFDGGDE